MLRRRELVLFCDAGGQVYLRTSSIVSRNAEASVATGGDSSSKAKCKEINF